ESNYRPERWGSLREPYKFTGKEEDVEVGLVYFGARYLSLGLAQWMSADPVTIHQVRSDINAYAYVMGRPLVAVDPDGRELITVGALLGAIAVGALIGGAAGGAYYSATTDDWDGWEFTTAVVAGGVAGAIG